MIQLDSILKRSCCSAASRYRPCHLQGYWDTDDFAAPRETAHLKRPLATCVVRRLRVDQWSRWVTGDFHCRRRRSRPSCSLCSFLCLSLSSGLSVLLLLMSDAASSEAETKAVEINGVMQKQSTRDQIMSLGIILPYQVRCFGTFFWWSGTGGNWKLYIQPLPPSTSINFHDHYHCPGFSAAPIA